MDEIEIKSPCPAGTFYFDVIEYKGGHLIEFSQEKKNIGDKREETSHNKVLFLMAVKRDEKGWDVYRQIEDKVR